MNKINERLIKVVKEDDDVKMVILVIACILLALLVITISLTIGSFTHFAMGMLAFIGLGALGVYGVFYAIAWLDVNNL